MTLTAYRGGVMTLSQAGEILMLMVRAEYPGTSTYGIKIGSRANEVLVHYGVPSRRVELSSMQSWAYDAHRTRPALRRAGGLLAGVVASIPVLAHKVISWVFIAAEQCIREQSRLLLNVRRAGGLL